jgi:hypothetical protein
MLAYGRESVDGALETIKRVGVSGSHHLKREIVVIAADLTSSHRSLLSGIRI